MVCMANIGSLVSNELFNIAGRMRAYFAAQGPTSTLGHNRGWEVCPPGNFTFTDRPTMLGGAVTNPAHRLHHPRLARLLLADQKGVIHTVTHLGSSWPCRLQMSTRELNLTSLRSLVTPGGLIFQGAPLDP